jgi:hypothetical protein
MTDDDMISAACVTPAFGGDLSTWRVTISREGCLRQEVSLATSANSYRGELREEVVQLHLADVQEMLAFADRIGFRDFRDHYTFETMIVTDLPTWAISVRYGDRIKTVEAYGPAGIARLENNRHMGGFVELWERIHRHAPYPKAEPRAPADRPRD